MKVLVVEPNSLVGKELREMVEAASDPRLQIELAAVSEEGVSTLTRLDDEAALVTEITPESLRDADVAVLCGRAARQRRAVEMARREATQLVVAATELDHPEGTPVVAGLGDRELVTDEVLVSPYPATIALGHLLAPLVERGLARASATVLLPASSQDNAGLDELFEQARSLLTFAADKPVAVYGHQLAFNLLPGPSAEAMRRHVARILDREIDLSVQLLQSPVFHGVAVSLLVEVDPGRDEADIRAAIDASPYCEAVEADEGLGPIDSTRREEILVGRIAADADRPGAFWIWAVMDNLRRGGASNVLAILQSLADRATG